MNRAHTHSDDTDSVELEEISKAHIFDSSGVSYRDFRQTLKPRLTQVWLELLSGHVALIGIFFTLRWVESAYPSLWPVEILLGSIFVGYFYAYIQLFFHEASHYNIARSRALNDLLANIFIGPLAGLEISQYRKIHFDHHRHLGTTSDPERSYFRALNARFIFEALSGKQVFDLLVKRSQPGQVPQYNLGDSKGRMQLFLGFAVNGAIILLLVGLKAWVSAVAWSIGVLVFFPFFTALRQVLEHRDEMADPFTDYSLVDHGETNRLFGDGPLASTFGGAGFNRHFLHHWDPQISYTCLRKLESYLANTPLKEKLALYRTSYGGTFLRLFDPRWY